MSRHVHPRYLVGLAQWCGLVIAATAVALWLVG